MFMGWKHTSGKLVSQVSLHRQSLTVSQSVACCQSHPPLHHTLVCPSVEDEMRSEMRAAQWVPAVFHPVESILHLPQLQLQLWLWQCVPTWPQQVRKWADKKNERLISKRSYNINFNSIFIIESEKFCNIFDYAGQQL